MKSKPTKNAQCATVKCPNRRSQGTFVGDYCLPCHTRTNKMPVRKWRTVQTEKTTTAKWGTKQEVEAFATRIGGRVREMQTRDVKAVRAEIERWDTDESQERPIYQFRMDAIIAAEKLGILPDYKRKS